MARTRWPIAAADALVNTAAGASWVSIHNGGGVGIGYSLHAGQVTVADGTDMMASRIERVLTTDPGMGVIRHVDAGMTRRRSLRRRRACEFRCEVGQPSGTTDPSPSATLRVRDDKTLDDKT